MFPLKLACISPHLEGGTVYEQFVEQIFKLRRLFSKDNISILLAIIGISVTSGVCYLTLCQAHPIFAYEGDYVSYRTKAEIMSPKEIEQTEYIRWKSATDIKYKNMITSRPAKGIIHAKTVKWINKKPIRVNIVEINQKANSKLQIKPKTANDEVLNRKATIRKIAMSENSIIAINGGYFKPQTGVPLGTLVIDKVVLTGPIYNRVAMGINKDGTFSMDRSNIDITVKAHENSIKADNINQPRMLSTHTLIYTKKWGTFTPPAPKYGMSIAVSGGKVVNFNFGSIEIPKDGFAIVGPKQNLEKILRDKNLSVNIKFSDALNNSEHIIGGGPYLVKDGQMYVDIKEEKFGAINGKNPRTAIGYTKNNEIIIITVDGREETSVGMTLWEISRLMKDLGCENAMNLDGGGSSVIYVRGKIQNTPAYREGIAISNALVVNEVEQEPAIAQAL